MIKTTTWKTYGVFSLFINPTNTLCSFTIARFVSNCCISCSCSLIDCSAFSKRCQDPKVTLSCLCLFVACPGSAGWWAVPGCCPTYGEQCLVWQQVKCVAAYRDMPARNCLSFQWAAVMWDSWDSKSWTLREPKRMAKHPRRLNGMYQLGMIWHSCNENFAPVSQYHFFSA